MQEITPISFWIFCKCFSAETPIWVCFDAYEAYLLFICSKFKQMRLQSRDVEHLIEKIKAVKWSNSWPEVGKIIIENHVICPKS